MTNLATRLRAYGAGQGRVHLVVVGVALACSVPALVGRGLDGHDLRFHVLRYLGAAAGMVDGQLLAQVDPEGLGGYGTASNLFYGPLSAYLAALFHAVTGSWPVTLWLLAFIGLAASGLTMCALVRAVGLNRIAATVAAVAYITAPYHVGDLWVRQAHGEVAAFVFIPLVFHGLYLIGWPGADPANSVRSAWWRGGGVVQLGLGAAGLVLTHLLSAAMVAGLAALFVLAFARRFLTWRRLGYLLTAAALTIGLTAFYWAPLLEARATGIYQAFLPQAQFAQMAQAAPSKALGPVQLFWTQPKVAAGLTEFAPVAIGLFSLLGLAGLIWTWRSVDPDRKRLLAVYGALGLLCVVGATKLMPWAYLPKALWTIQFPWRLLEPATFFLSFLAGVGMAGLAARWRLRTARVGTRRLVAVALLLAALAPITPILAGGIERQGRIDTLRTSQWAWVGGSLGEYLPLAVGAGEADMNRLLARPRLPKEVSGDGVLGALSIDGTRGRLDLAAGAGGLTVELPWIYFPGYTARLITDHAGTDQLTVSASANGLLQVRVPGGSTGRLETWYGTSPATLTGLIISLVTVVGFGLSFGLGWVTGRRRPTPGGSGQSATKPVTC